MPELPEVETIRRQLDQHLTGRSVVATDTRWHKSLTGRFVDPTAVLHRPVTRVWRRGKLLGIDTEGGISVLVHLRMTGQLVLESAHARRPSSWDTTSTRVVLDLDDGSRLFFNDQREIRPHGGPPHRRGAVRPTARPHGS